MARITKRKFLNLSPSEIGKLKAPELRELLRGVRKLFDSQEKTFNKYEKNVYSPALDKMEDYYDNNGKKPVSRMNMNGMRNEVFRLQEFFDSDTSTVPGARKVAIEQDKRIFGVNNKGKPNYRMNTEQRTSLWKIFNEYKNLRPADVLENSNIVQQAVGQLIIDSAKTMGANLELSSATLADVQRRVEDLRDEMNWEMDEDYDADEVSSINRID